MIIKLFLISRYLILVSILVSASYLILLLWDGIILFRLPRSIQFKLKSFQTVHRRDIDCNLQMSIGIFAYQYIFFIFVSPKIFLWECINTLYLHISVSLFQHRGKSRNKKKKNNKEETPALKIYHLFWRTGILRSWWVSTLNTD